MFIKTLNNGLKVYIQKDEKSDVVTNSYLVECGSFNESNYNNGIAHFTEHMLFKGTTNRDFAKINRDIERIGGISNAETSYDYTKYYNVVPVSEWKIGLEVVSDLVWNNTIPEEEFEKEKNVVLEEICMYMDDPQSVNFENLNDIMTGNYSNRKSIAGTIESVSAITRDEMLKFIDEFYSPNNMILVITGNVAEEEVVEFLESYIDSDIKLNKIQEIEDINMEEIEPKEVTIELRDIAQSYVAFGVNVPSIHNEDHCAIELFSYIFGGNACSILYNRIRENEGLAYTVRVLTESFKDCTQVIGFTGLNKSNIEKFKNAVIEEIEKIIENGIDSNIFEDAKSSLIGSTILDLESNRSKNSYISECLKLGIDYDVNNYINEINKVTISDVNYVAKKYFSTDKFSFSYVIPKQ